MPATVNGIGTWYWGRRNVLVRKADCGLCGAFGDLTSYDTTLFFVVVFVPVIPLGQKRILDQCPNCRKHRVMTLPKYQEAREKSVAEAVDAARAAPSDPAKAVEAIGAVVAFHEPEKFMALAAQIRERLGTDTGVQLALGHAYAGFGAASDAESAYRRALQARDDPETREALAFHLIYQGRPQEAQPLLQHVLQGRLADKSGFLLTLSDGFMAIGDHERAMGLLDACSGAFPLLASDKALLQRRRTAEKNLGSGKRIPPAGGAAAGAATRFRSGWSFGVPRRLAAAVFIGAMAIHLVAASRAGQSRLLHLVNGLPRAYEVEVNGARCTLPPHGVVPVHIAEGEVRVQVIDPSLAIEPVVHRIVTPFFTRPFLHPVFVVNPDGLALLAWERVVYGQARSSDTAGQMFRVDRGTRLHVFDDVDYAFQEFPGELQVPEGGRLMKDRVTNLVDLTPFQAVALLEPNGGEEAVQSYLRESALLGVQVEACLFLLGQRSEPEPLLRFLREHLGDRPVRVDLHRFYIWRMEVDEPERDIAAEYRGHLEKSPDNTTLLYLAGRATVNPSEAEVLFRRSAEGCPACPYGWNALAFAGLAAGRFEEAFPPSCRALELAPDVQLFQAVQLEILTALGRVDEAVERCRSMRETWPNPFGCIAAEASLRARGGDLPGAQACIEEYCSFVEAQEGGEVVGSIRTSLRASVAYASGDAEGAGRMLLEAQGVAGQRFGAFIDLRQWDQASQALVEAPEADGASHLLLYCAAASEGRMDLAERHLALGAAGIRAHDRDQRLVADILEGKAPLHPDEMLALAEFPAEKRILLAALGTRFPEHRDALFPLARRLNYDRGFPYLTLKRLLGEGGE